MRLGKILTNLALLTFSVLLVVLGFEILVRFMDVKKPEWKDTPKKYYLHESITDNRDYPITPEKPANTYRIFVIGDSFTYGGAVQLDDTLPKRLEKNLNLNIKQPTVQVVNWGYPGYSTAMEVRGVDTALKHFQPDLIILAMTLNDAELQRYSPPKYMDKNGNIILGGGLTNYWRGLAFILTRYYNSKSHEDYINYHLNLFKNRDTLIGFQSAIQMIKDHCANRKVPLIGVLWPMFSYPLDETYPFKPAHQKIAEIYDEEQIPLLDLFDSFRGIPPERIQIIPGRDSHPNEIGYRIAADRTYEFLVANHLIPPEAVVKQAKRNRRELQPTYPRVKDPNDDNKNECCPCSGGQSSNSTTAEQSPAEY